MVTYSSQLSRCYENQQCFNHIQSSGLVDGQELTLEEMTRVCVSVSDALQYVDSLSPARIAVLVTGSLHLIGSVMSVLGFSVEDL